MEKVKIFRSCDQKKMPLEEVINQWLDEHRDIEVIDRHSHLIPGNKETFYIFIVMIFYRIT